MSKYYWVSKQPSTVQGGATLQPRSIAGEDQAVEKIFEEVRANEFAGRPSRIGVQLITTKPSAWAALGGQYVYSVEPSGPLFMADEGLIMTARTNLKQAPALARRYWAGDPSMSSKYPTAIVSGPIKMIAEAKQGSYAGIDSLKLIRQAFWNCAPYFTRSHRLEILAHIDSRLEKLAQMERYLKVLGRKREGPSEHPYPRVPVFRRNEDYGQGFTRMLDEYRDGAISGVADFVKKKRREGSPIKDLYVKKKRKKKASDACSETRDYWSEMKGGDEAGEQAVQDFLDYLDSYKCGDDDSK